MDIVGNLIKQSYPDINICSPLEPVKFRACHCHKNVCLDINFRHDKVCPNSCRVGTFLAKTRFLHSIAGNNKNHSYNNQSPASSDSSPGVVISQQTQLSAVPPQIINQNINIPYLTNIQLYFRSILSCDVCSPVYVWINRWDNIFNTIFMFISTYMSPNTINAQSVNNIIPFLLMMDQMVREDSLSNQKTYPNDFTKMWINSRIKFLEYLEQFLTPIFEYITVNSQNSNI